MTIDIDPEPIVAGVRHGNKTNGLQTDLPSAAISGYRVESRITRRTGSCSSIADEEVKQTVLTFISSAQALMLFGGRMPMYARLTLIKIESISSICFTWG